MHRLCIVGSGITGAVTAWLLKQSLPQLNIVILEKARGTGGRMCTSRGPVGSSLDLGAQFISRTTALNHTQKQCYTELLKAGLLHPLTQTVEGLVPRPTVTDNFICPHGSGSIVKHFLQLAGCEILFKHRVEKISLSDDSKWQITCDNNSSDKFDAVILTVPVPQILQIEGMTSQLQDEELENLKAVQYSSRFALGLYYDCDIKYFDSISWTEKYISDDNVLRFCSLDFRKRSESSLPSVVVHTTKEYGRAYVDSDSSDVQTLILHKLKEKLLPNLPEPSHVKFHKWRYSQVEKNYSGEPGCLVISKSPPLVVGGDGFSYSTFEGCIHSAVNIVENILLCK